MRRALAALAGAALIFVALMGSASAAPTGYCSKTRGLPGDKLVVRGQDGIAGESAILNFNTKAIGGNTVDGYGFWTIVGHIPRHAVPGTYAITVTFSPSATSASPCFFRVTRRR